MTVKAADLIALFWQALNEGWGYIWGRYGQIWTAADQAAVEKTTSSVYAKAREYGEKWIGHIVADCSGLAYWAFKKLGGTMYHGSDTIWHQYVTDRCELQGGARADGAALLPGDPVFKKRMKDGKPNRHHIGYYIGLVDGKPKVIEAKSTYYGVVMSDLSEWHETAHWLNVEYEGGKIFVGKPTLRRGDSGEDVKYLQGLLNKAGEYLEVDGVFGRKTEIAVKDFQYEHGLKDDGIVGDMTWAALERAVGDESLLLEEKVPPKGADEVSSNDDYTEPVDGLIVPADSVVISRADWAAVKSAWAAMGNAVRKYD